MATHDYWEICKEELPPLLTRPATSRSKIQKWCQHTQGAQRWVICRKPSCNTQSCKLEMDWMEEATMVKYDDKGMQKRLISIVKYLSLAPALKTHDYCELCNNKWVLSLSLYFSTNRQIDDPAIQGAETEGSLWTTHNPGKWVGFGWCEFRAKDGYIRWWEDTKAAGEHVKPLFIISSSAGNPWLLQNMQQQTLRGPLSLLFASLLFLSAKCVTTFLTLISSDGAADNKQIKHSESESNLFETKMQHTIVVSRNGLEGIHWVWVEDPVVIYAGQMHKRRLSSPSWAAGGLHEICIHDPYYKGMPGGGEGGGLRDYRLQTHSTPQRCREALNARN